jgi:hypothetical protein
LLSGSVSSRIIIFALLSSAFNCCVICVIIIVTTSLITCCYSYFSVVIPCTYKSKLANSHPAKQVNAYTSLDNELAMCCVVIMRGWRQLGR